MQYKNKITIIIPTKNRSEYLNKFLIHCQKVFKNFDHSYIIIDGSDAINYKKNIFLLKKFKKLKIIKQRSKGIQIGCCEALNYVKSKYVVFLYDDDELSSEISKIYKSNFNDKKVFSFGHGIVQDINKKIKFKKLNLHEINKSNLLLSYFGSDIKQFLNFKKIKYNIHLPVSPISSCYKLSFLNLWKKKIFYFTKNNNFRNYFFFKKEVGPDLLIYLFSIKEATRIKFFTPYVAKFSSHKDSISIIYGSNFLRIGYWLARVCFYEDYDAKDQNVRNYLYTYLLTTGLFLLIYNIFNLYYFKNIFLEILKLLNSKKKKFVFRYMIKIINVKIFGHEK